MQKLDLSYQDKTPSGDAEDMRSTNSNMWDQVSRMKKDRRKKTRTTTLKRQSFYKRMLMFLALSDS